MTQETSLLEFGLTSRSMKMAFFHDHYRLAHRTHRQTQTCTASKVETAFGLWHISSHVEEGDGRICFEMAFTACEQISIPSAVGLQFEISHWSTEHYVLMPAAAYAGNRFQVAASHRPRTVAFDLSPNGPITISSIPRLEIGKGTSRIQLLSGDFATPCIGYRADTEGFFLLSEQGNTLGDFGLSLEESDDRTSAVIRIKSPGVREQVRYNGTPSFDRGRTFEPGESVSFKFALFFFPAPTIADLFEHFFRIRNTFAGAPKRTNHIPFSACWEIQQQKYNQQNWVEDRGYYSVGMRECASQDWQTGWTGGTNAFYALLAEGSQETKSRALRMPEFLAQGGVSPTGYFQTLYHNGEWLMKDFALTRYQADSLYFMTRAAVLFEAKGGTISHTWRTQILGCANAFCDTWEKNSQFGQWINPETGTILVGETACAALAPGALAVAGKFFHDDRMLAVAEAAAEALHQRFVSIGILNGGPGDILQAPDSEAAFAALETFVTLHEITGNPSYLAYAKAAAHQAASYVMSYDYQFPANSTFGKLGMGTIGTVFANVKNKHSAPGICTLSGESLLKLFRVTGDTAYLTLLAEIAHAIPQFMSREDRPITDRRPGQRWPVMPPGWINERVNTSDWEVRLEPDSEIGIGEIFGGSTWSEVAMMLTWTELPGIYLQPDTGLLCVFDHVEAVYDAASRTLQIINPTAFHASVKVLMEDAESAAYPLEPCFGSGLPRIEVEAGQTLQYHIQYLHNCN